MYEARNVLRQNQSHPLARDDNAVDNDRHGEKSKLRFISGENPFVPGHRDPTVPVSQCHGLCHVTLTCRLCTPEKGTSWPMLVQKKPLQSSMNR